MAFSLRINGMERTIVTAEPETTLLDYLRSLGLSGAKEGCAQGECGSCAVLSVEEGESGRSCLRALNSCLIPLPAAADREIYTVEALGRPGRLSLAQSCLVEAGACQCGYCMPGFVISLTAEQSRLGNRPLRPDALFGNLCRCGGYRPIRKAASRLEALRPNEPLALRLQRPPPPLRPLSPEEGRGRFFRPTSLEGCWELIRRYPEARWVSGSTDLAVDSNLRGRRPPVWISLEGIEEIRRFSDGEEWLEIGAGLSLQEIEERMAAHAPLPSALARWFVLFGSPLVRNRATLGGNLATASPVGDAAPLLLALDARLRLLSAEGSREVALSGFFSGNRRTALAPGELIASVRIPKPFPYQLRFFKIAKRPSNDIATVSLGMGLRLDASGRVESLRLALGGVSDRPIRLFAAESAMAGAPWNSESLRRAGELLRSDLAPISDLRGSAAYRLALVRRLLEKCLREEMEAAS
ncbi:xanthine dehydrogenase small subunit [Methylacidimicrobium cyclopophantes]|uniref:Xanthine dehydrogenase small subunit n=1 Tax=Methylacidimicrobium cyclopophantes TaxID=1041766 RepID=A0A5E6MGP4_9BACT|nr:FAD binding domain-containing protein [Methylacidimicrobium cyclopophantes]VVM08281.1 xanthine dehydrogenase small subunit [Methylacidimicrobium cyclopophantes]